MNITPGTQTTEFKLSATVVAIALVLYAALMALATPLHIPTNITAAATAVVPIVAGGVTVTYTISRGQVKAAFLNAQTQQTLLQAQVAAATTLAPSGTLTNSPVQNANTAAMAPPPATLPTTVNPEPVNPAPVAPPPPA